MTDYIRNHAIICQLITLHRALREYLEFRNAKGYMQEDETAQLRDALFAFNAEYQKVRWSLASLLPRPQFVALQEAIEASSAAAVCLLGGRHDCPAYVSVDPRRLAACLTLMERGINRVLTAPQARKSLSESA